jgi:beta-phosphoglucomutase-like phosphatase (HAD superfamily)
VRLVIFECDGDRHGVAAARAAGMDVLAWAGGVRRPDVLAGPRIIVFDDMRTLPQLITAR